MPLLKFVPDMLGILDVAFGVHNNGAEDSINRIAGAQPCSDCLVKVLGRSKGERFAANANLQI